MGCMMGLDNAVWRVGGAGIVLSQSGTITVRIRDCRVTSLAFASEASRL